MVSLTPRRAITSGEGCRLGSTGIGVIESVRRETGDYFGYRRKKRLIRDHWAYGGSDSRTDSDDRGHSGTFVIGAETVWITEAPL